MKLSRLFVLGLLITGLPFLNAQTPPPAAPPVTDAPAPAPTPAPGDLPAAPAKPAKPAKAKKQAKASKAKAAKGDKEAAGKAEAAAESYPFHGVVESVNTTASTVVLSKDGGQRVLHMDGKTKLARAGKSATLSDLKAGDHAHGKLHKNTRGEEVIADAKFDTEAPKKDAGADEKKPAKKASKKGKKADGKKGSKPSKDAAPAAPVPPAEPAPTPAPVPTPVPAPAPTPTPSPK